MSQASKTKCSDYKVDDGEVDSSILTAQNAGKINIFYLPPVTAIKKGVIHGLVPLK